jgi:hypothetical protein
LNDRLTDFGTLADTINRAAEQIPAPGATMPENELRPDPARLAMELNLLKYRVDALEKNPCRPMTTPPNR